MSAIAQTSTSSTQATPSPTASPDVSQALKELKTDTSDIRRQLADRQIARMIGELRAGRTLTAAQAQEIAALEERLKAELNNSASLERSLASAVREIDSLRKALDFADVAIAAQKETIVEVKTQRDEARAAAKSANKRTGLLIVAGALLTALKVFVF